MTIQIEPEELRRVVDGLSGRAEKSFLLMAPTHDMFSPQHEGLLQRKNAHFLALADNFLLDGAGAIILKRPAEEILAPFLSSVLPAPTDSSSLGRLAEEYPKDKRVFQRQGTTWLLVYNGIPKSVSDMVGMSYVRQLLQNPGQDTHAAVMRELGVDDGDTPLLGSAGDVLDGQALKEYREHLKDLEEEIREAESNHDIGKTQQLKEELEAITAEIGRATGLGGRNRKAADDRERARQAVSVAIHRALKAVKKEHEPLWQHLHNSLKIGEFLSYQPDQPTFWTT